MVRVVVPDRTGYSFGSGVLVFKNASAGLVLTNWHVVCDATGRVTVVFPSRFTSGASIVRADRQWDLAALLIAPPGAEPVSIGTVPPQPGDPLWIAGYGSGRYRMVAGRCTQYVAPGPNQPFQMLEVSVPARQGDSGGPIFNDRGQLVGILFGSAGGATVGSYCGRLQWFTQLALGDLSRQSDLLATTTQPATASGSSSSPVGRTQGIAVDWSRNPQSATAASGKAALGSTAWYDPTEPIGSTAAFQSNRTTIGGIAQGAGGSPPGLPMGRTAVAQATASTGSDRFHGERPERIGNDHRGLPEAGWISRAEPSGEREADPSRGGGLAGAGGNHGASESFQHSQSPQVPVAISRQPQSDRPVGFEQIRNLLALVGAVLLLVHGLRLVRVLQ